MENNRLISTVAHVVSKSKSVSFLLLLGVCTAFALLFARPPQLPAFANQIHAADASLLSRTVAPIDIKTDESHEFRCDELRILELPSSVAPDEAVRRFAAGEGRAYGESDLQPPGFLDLIKHQPTAPNKRALYMTFTYRADHAILLKDEDDTASRMSVWASRGVSSLQLIGTGGLDVPGPKVLNLDGLPQTRSLATHVLLRATNGKWSSILVRCDGGLHAEPTLTLVEPVDAIRHFMKSLYKDGAFLALILACVVFTVNSAISRRSGKYLEYLMTP